MSKKKPSKKTPEPTHEDVMREACQEIVENLYAEVFHRSSERLDEIAASISALADRVAAVEKQVACRHRRPFGGWLCMPWCRRWR